MSGRPFRKLLVLVAIAAVVAAVAKQLRGKPAPQFANHPTVNGGPGAVPDRPAPTERSAASPVAELAAPEAPAGELAAPEAPAGELAAPEAPAGELTAPPAEPELTATTSGGWVDPVDGACPDGYPIKAKVKSGIYHQPGSVTYDRTKPDRCYPSVAAAEADGLRAPKR